MQEKLMEEPIEETLQKRTGFSEDVIGCYLFNFKKKHVCPVALNGWCKDYMKCKLLESIYNIDRKRRGGEVP